VTPPKKRRKQEKEQLGLPIEQLNPDKVMAAQVLPPTAGDESTSDKLCDRIDKLLSSIRKWKEGPAKNEC